MHTREAEQRKLSWAWSHTLNYGWGAILRLAHSASQSRLSRLLSNLISEKKLLTEEEEKDFSQFPTPKRKLCALQRLLRL